jgi:hypothetical protein
MARLAADDPSDVTMSGGIIGEHNITRPETPYRTVADLDFDMSGKRNDVLAPRRVVKIAQMARRRATKENPMRGLELGYFHMSMQVKFNIYFFEVRFVVGAGVKSNDLHQSACRRIGRKKQGRG